MKKTDKLQHIGIITDGNRRWATKKGLPKIFGHTQGAKNLKQVAIAILEHGIPYLTMWCMSTENLKRSKKELKHLFSLFGQVIDYVEDLKKHGVKLNIIGDLTKIPDTTRKKMLKAQEETKLNTAMTLTLAVVYGGRDDIVRASKKIMRELSNPELISENYIASRLDTADMPDIDLVIRTGGHYRFSNFLLWQSAYAELYFTDTLFPDLHKKEIDKAIEWYYDQKRNFGR